MKLERILEFARSLLRKTVSEGDIAIDCTIGNGLDTVFLAELTGSSGHVFGFDIQKQALQNTRERLTKAALLDRVTLNCTGHEHIKAIIPTDFHGKITAAIFNLGYLPGSDKSIVTTPNTTIAAVRQLLEIMASEAMIVLVIYHGHPGGKLEKEKLLSFVSELPQEQVHVLQYQFINQQNCAPFIIAIEKRIEKR